MIRFPNTFQRKNITFIVKSNISIDMTTLYDDTKKLPKKILEKIKRVEEFFVTFAEMTSTINEEKKVEFKEVIVKIPISYNGKNYVFPIISYVTDEYSLIRGRIMGFNKKFSSNIQIQEGKINFSCDDFYLQYIFSQDDFKSDESIKCSEAPFILFRNYNVEFPVNDIVTLKNEEYILKNKKRAFFNEDNINASILSIPLNIIDILYTEDTFKLCGLKKVNKDEN